MINFDETFFVGLSVVLFIAISYNPLKKLLQNYIDNRVVEIKEKLEQAEKLKKEAEILLASYLNKQQEIQQEIKKLTENTENEIKIINDNAAKQLSIILKQRADQAIQRINQFETSIINDVRNQAVEIAFIAVKSIIRERMSIEDSERLINNVIDELNTRIN